MSIKQCPGCMCTEEFCDCTIMLINTREQRDKLKSELTRLSGQTGFCVLCEAYAKEHNALKAEVEKLKNDLSIVGQADLLANRDTWKKLAEGLIKEARLIESYFEDQREIVLHVNDVRPLLEVIAAYDAVQKGRGA